MRTILTLVGKDFANFRRNRAALVLTFLVPISLIYIFGQVFGLNRKDTGPSGITLAVVNDSDNPAAQKLVDALKAEPAFRVRTTYVNADKSERPLTEDDARTLIHDREFRFAVIIPKDMIADTRVALHLKILSDPRNEIETQTVNGILQKTIFSNVPQLLGQALQARAKAYLGGAGTDAFNRSIVRDVVGTFGGNPDKILENIRNGNFGIDRLANRLTSRSGASGATGAPPAGDGDVFSRIVKIDSEQVVGKDVKSPEATRVIGGQAMMFLLFALSGGSAAFFDEKNTGIFQRLLSAPVSRAQLMWSRFLWGMLLGLVQLTALFVAGHYMFGVDVFHHVGGLLVICASAAAACTAFGMFIAAFTPNAQAASGLATFLVLTMSATGGAWFPISLMPPFMQTVGKFTITYWSMEGFSQVLWAGDPLVKILPTIALLLGIAGAVMALSIWRLNRRNIFG